MKPAMPILVLKYKINPSILLLESVTLTSMRRELQSQNRVNGDYEKTTGPIYLKFWQKFLLMSTTEIQK